MVKALVNVSIIIFSCSGVMQGRGGGGVQLGAGGDSYFNTELGVSKEVGGGYLQGRWAKHFVRWSKFQFCVWGLSAGRPANLSLTNVGAILTLLRIKGLVGLESLRTYHHHHQQHPSKYPSPPHTQKRAPTHTPYAVTASGAPQSCVNSHPDTGVIQAKKKDINKNTFGGLSWDWVCRRICLCLFLRSFRFGGWKITHTKSPENSGTIL